MENRLQIPQGVSDFYGDTAYGKRRIEDTLRGCFLKRGFEEVETPSLEYFDTFKGEMGGIREESTVRFFDQDGRMLALRPDLTMPVARMAAVRPGRTGVQRYCYIGNAYGMEQEYGMKRREFTQAGCELLGAEGPEADAEILLTAAQALLSLGIQDFVLDLGHVGFLQAVCQDVGLSPEQTAIVGALLDEKNETELAAYLEVQGLDEAAIGHFTELVYLFGDESVLDRARKRFPIPGCTAIVEYLERVCAIVKAMELPFTVSVDLGMAPNLDYYTGMVFRGMSPLLGFSLLSGGRYDTLMAQFARPMAAVGFAMGVGNALYVLERMEVLPKRPRLDCLIGCQEGGEELFLQASQLQQEGKTVALSYAKTQEAFLEEARRLQPACGLYYRDGKLAARWEV